MINVSMVSMSFPRGRESRERIDDLSLDTRLALQDGRVLQATQERLLIAGMTGIFFKYDCLILINWR